MAKQRGIVFFEGTLGGINFYYRKGVPTARTAGGGFIRTAIKKGANMVRVRENNSEFSGCSQVNKAFKQAIVPFMIGYKDGTLHSRLMQLFLKLKDLDSVSKRGERQVSYGIETSYGKQLLTDFVFTPKRSNLLSCDYGFDWDTLEFRVSGYSRLLAQFPKDADYMELLVGVVRFDFATRSYSQVLAEPFVIERDFTGDQFSVAVSGLPEGTGHLLALARIGFYQEVNGTGYVLAGDGSFRLAVVGIKT